MTHALASRPRRIVESQPLESRQLLSTNGLTATYFDNTDFTGTSVQRVDAGVNLSGSAHASPVKGIAGDTFSVRWSGLIRPSASEIYTFTVRNNDGVRLWVNGKSIINAWKSSARKTHTGKITLTRNHYYDLRVEYFDSTKAPGITLDWSSASTHKAPVPTSRLFSYDSRFGAIGDFGFTNTQAQDTAKRVLGWNPDFVISVGDNSYSGNYDKDVGTYYHSLIGNYSGSHGKGAKTNRFFPALGNHDWDYENRYASFFSLPNNERYYDFVRGPIHFFVLDSDPHEPDGTSSTSKQADWLKPRLQGSKSLYNIVYFHHAPYSSGKHANTGYMRWPFKKWGADAVLAGHDHHYERLIEDGGIPYFVDGAGAGTRSLNSPVPGSKFLDNKDSGALLIQANDKAMTFTYEQRGAGIVDSYIVSPRKH